MSFGANIQRETRSSQATPFAEDFLKLMQGYVNSLTTPTPGPDQQQGVGGSPQQMTNFFSRFGGVNTAGAMTDETPRLMDAITSRSNLQTDRNAAAIRESFGAAGNRLGIPLARAEGQARNEAGMNLEQTLASILFEQAGRAQAARQFDVSANQQAISPFLQLASLGIIPEEIIATPGVGSQLLNGVLSTAGSYFGGGGDLGFLRGLFGGNNSPPTLPNPGGQLPGQPRGGYTQPPRQWY